MPRAVAIGVVSLAFLLMAFAVNAQNFGIPAADRFFRLDWQTHRSPRWGEEVVGYVYNDYGAPATNLRLLLETLDAGGGVTGRSVLVVPGTVPGGGRLYFEQRVPPAAAYRLRVLSWDFLRGGGS
ncbi:MAG TPA: hypothetical protein VNK50_04220 [Calidithermus sp.]|nr:hypothetical protein [Calidithermus sp.]